MLTFVKAYQTSDGQTHASLEAAQQHEISEMLADGNPLPTPTHLPDIAKMIMDHRDKILDILTTKPSSRPAARKANGGTKKRKPAVTEPVAVAQ
jgi:hypothetical protein